MRGFGLHGIIDLHVGWVLEVLGGRGDLRYFPDFLELAGFHKEIPDFQVCMEVDIEGREGSVWFLILIFSFVLGECKGLWGWLFSACRCTNTQGLGEFVILSCEFWYSLRGSLGH